MPSLLVRHATLLVTLDDDRRRVPDGGLYIQDGVIQAVGPTSDLPPTADQVIEARGHLVLPGLVNCHHHLYQTLTRALPAAQDANLFHWLKTLYPVWAELDADAVYTSALVGLSELLLSGCTTAADHLYLFPNGARLDDEIQAARELG
ncbi:MAG: amidohydrolase family protein, partial [Anaerolineae bacterium]|nr:amidohydrolase family protein [Anaerolineae bacterium]